eukprot:scaffold252840_cov24-Tisochrysis_lutea.AAC.1
MSRISACAHRRLLQKCRTARVTVLAEEPRAGRPSKKSSNSLRFSGVNESAVRGRDAIGDRL